MAMVMKPTASFFLPPLAEVTVSRAPLYSLGLLYEDLPFWAQALRLWESVSFGSLGSRQKQI